MRILWYSNAPHVGSGYGNQTDLFVPRLRRLGHEMAIAAFWGIQGNRVESDGITIYPSSVSEGIDQESMVLPARHHQADIIISLLDFWVFPPNMSAEFSLCPWFPIDHEPLMPPIISRLKQPSPLNILMPIVFSQFGERMMRQAGFDCRYVPHGVDTSIYKPGDKLEARQLLGLPKDAFIYGIVAANTGSPSRKAIKQQMMAFAQIRRQHGDAILYMHTRRNTAGTKFGGENLPELAEQLGIADAVVFTDDTAYHLGLESEELAALYRSFDVLSSVSMGEGFGIPILEAQACGTPVIVGDWTSMSELCFSGWKVPVEASEPYHTPLASYQRWPHVTGIYEQMQAAYDAGQAELKTRGLAAEIAADVYDVEYVTDHFWEPVLHEIGAMLEARKRVPAGFGAFVGVR